MPVSTSEEEGQALPPPHNVRKNFGGEGTGPSPHNVGVYLMAEQNDEPNVLRPQTYTCGYCRGRSSSLSEIMQIVTSAARRFSPSRS